MCVLKGILGVSRFMSSSLISLMNALALTALIIFLICLGTLTPNSQTVDVPGSDKWHHFLAFAALTVPLICVKVDYWKIIVPFALIFGATIEVIQPYVDRYRDIYDFYADAIGILIGVIIGIAINLFYGRRPKCLRPK